MDLAKKWAQQLLTIISAAIFKGMVKKLTSFLCFYVFSLRLFIVLVFAKLVAQYKFPQNGVFAPNHEMSKAKLLWNEHLLL